MENKENNINPNPEPEIEVEIEEITVSETPEQPAEASANQSMEVPVETEVQPLFGKQSQPAKESNGEPKPKKKIGMIIAICVAAVLLIGGGVFAAIYFSWRNSDPVVILNAVTGFMKKDKIAVNGTMDVSFNSTYQKESGLKSVKITLDSDSDKPNVSGNSKLSLVTSDDKTVDVAVGGAFVSDGTMYVKIEGIEDALSAIELPSEADAIMPYLDDLIEEVDGQWYKIQISDLNLGTEAEKSYQCFIDAINDESATKKATDKIVNLYKEHPFIVSNKQGEKDSKGNSVYDISWNAEDLASFMNGASDTEYFKSLQACSESSDVDTEDVTAKDLAVPEDMPTLNLHIDGSHELRGFSAKYEEDGNSLNAELYFEYDDKVKVEIPSDAKSVGDLMTDIEDAIMGVVKEMMQEQVKTQCSTYTGSLYNECIDYYSDAMDEYLKNMDFSDILSITGAGSA